MIDGVTVNNDNVAINKGEGGVASPPPSSTGIKQARPDQTADQVDLRPTQETAQTNAKPTQSESVAEQEAQAELEKSAKDPDLEKQLQKTVQALNDKLARLDREVEFKVDKRIDQNYISVIDKQSKETIREFPPEEIRTFIARFDEINDKLNMSSDVKSLIINLEV